MISTNSFRVPVKLASRTELMPSSSSLSFVANLTSVRSGMFPDKVTTKTGKRFKFTSLIIGSFVSEGRLAFPISTLSRTS